MWKLTLLGIAKVRTHRFTDAQSLLDTATLICSKSPASSCGYLIQAKGLLASENGSSEAAERFYRESLAFARAHGDAFLEANSLLNLGAESLTLGHFDEAIDRSEDGHRVASNIGAKIPELVTEGNLGWAFYRLGDTERAMDSFRRAFDTAVEVSDLYDQENLLTNVGYIHMDRRQFDMAARSFQQALDIAERIDAKQDIYNARRVLARFSLLTGRADEAALHADRALQLARESGNHVDELYPRLVQGQLAARRGNPEEAHRTFLEVENDPACPVFLKWEAEHSLARLFEDTNRRDPADRYYRIALATFEGARAEVRRDDSHLSFLTNGWRIYDDYIRFLAADNRTDDALRWADFSRARTLAEGLGNLTTRNNGKEPAALRPQEIARGVRGTLLFYWLGETQSYLWTIGARRTQLTVLPPGPEIETAATRYWKTLSGPQSGPPLADRDGQWLYRTLVAPVQESLPKDSRVFVIPDGRLNNINFETLIAPGPAPHFWIEDVTLANASSLRMLSAVYKSNSQPRRLLLIGNSVAPNDKYPELPRAAAQMAGVASHFPASQTKALSREQATPAAYLGAHPEQFSYLHFVAHGVASRTSPLDSAIILSPEDEPESFKLYARDIIRNQSARPLRAELVTISACYGTGVRAYTGEGLVGLSWAFLRAGARNVIGALWEASDSPTEQIMSLLYDGIQKGVPPSSALRDAKLNLLHNSRYANPFYWAPFQLHTQGRQFSAP